ncbi:MAG: ABC transporter ATP-binding protein/permease [Erysipelotrichaceae bacterium]|nr:ABC transporter ATP-binding protein/permease [Erysipelotrichaceae bacterium]
MDNIKQLWQFLKPYKWYFFTAILMIITTCFALSISPNFEGDLTSLLMANATDIINGVENARVDFEAFFDIVKILMGIYILKTISQSITTITLTHSIQSAMHDLRNELLEKVRKLPVSYFDKHQYGDVLSYITNDVDTLSTALQQTLSELIRGSLMLILGIIMMLRINVTMTLLVLLIIPLGLIITRIDIHFSQAKFDAQQEKLAELNATITEMYTGYKEIMLFNKQESAIHQFESINEELRENAFMAQFLSSIISPCISLITYIIIGSIGFMGCMNVLKGTMLVGELQAFIRYIWNVNDPISQVSQLSSQIQSAFAAMHRIVTLLNENEECDLIESKDISIKQSVDFHDLCFGYNDTEIIHHLDLHIKSGQMVAIVGPTGSGKTTLISLLLRFYDPTSGSITIDGVDIKDMTREDLRKMFGLVLQETWLFYGSIYDNIHYGRLDASKDEVLQAAKDANIDSFIHTLPQGYDTIINEEANNISQGEKQLLTIARAILKDPQILILDEATSSVDTRLEQMLQKAMNNVLKNRTSFVIAHRLSTIKNADLIVVIHNGKLIEQGTHEELMNKNGFYTQLYNAQFEDCL